MIITFLRQLGAYHSIAAQDFVLEGRDSGLFPVDPILITKKKVSYGCPYKRKN